MSLLIPIILSISLHLGLMMAIKDTNGNSNGNTNQKVTMKINQPNEKDGTDENKVNIVEKSPGIGKQCDKYYTGVGLTHNYPCIVDKVPVGYPAWRAGLRTGDVIVEPECWDVAGPENTFVKITFVRGDKVFHKTLKREKICEQ